MTTAALPTVNVLGTRVAALNMESAVDRIDRWIAQGESGRYVCVTGVHGVMESRRRPEVRLAHNSADACVPDGMPMTWVGRLRGHRTMNRVYGPDLMVELLGLSAKKGYSNFFFGGAEGVADDLKTRMVEKFPGLNVVGTYCPPFRPLRPDERDRLIAQVERVAPNIFWIGLSTPKQELFMHEYFGKLNATVMIGVGAAFDFHTDRVRQAPRWMMRAGLEWLFRFFTEPRRLGPRYLRNNPAFIWHILLQEAGVRRYPLD
jgi:N-acetylglucosaminyldiphosphoundecaprenol N-acetyl-beta-D-mannosaminyltransferase